MELTTNTSLSTRGEVGYVQKFKSFRVAGQCWLANSYRRFGTLSWHHLRQSVSPRKEATYPLSACYMIPQHTSVATVAGEVRRNGASTETLLQNINISLQRQTDRRHQLRWGDVLIAFNKTQQKKFRMEFSLLHRAFWLIGSFIAPTNAQHIYIETLKFLYIKVCNNCSYMFRFRLKSLSGSS